MKNYCPLKNLPECNKLSSKPSLSMASAPCVSIIVPVYNTEHFLPRCIDSLCSQSLEDIEIICINDGSTDKSRDILWHYAQKDHRIKIIDQENHGASSSRNRGLQYAKGHFIMFVDSDDWLDQDTCEILYKESINEKADIVCCAYMREYSNYSSEKKIFSQERIIWANPDEIINLRRRIIGPVRKELHNIENSEAISAMGGKLYRRNIIVNNNICFLDLKEIGTAEDAIFNFCVFRYATKIVGLQKALYHYRKNNSLSITTAHKPNLPKQWQRLFNEFASMIQSEHLDEIFSEALNNRISMSIIGLGFNELASNHSRREKCRMISNIIREKTYRNALKSLHLSYMRPHWFVFFMIIKLRLSWLVYIMLTLMNKLRNHN